jgi:hypothetical protein
LDEKWGPAVAGLGVDKVAAEVVVDGEAGGSAVVWAGAV